MTRYRIRPEHIVVYETSNRCCMLKWGVVHHKDKNPLNNDINNLQGMTRSDHSKYHYHLTQLMRSIDQSFRDMIDSIVDSSCKMKNST